MKYIAYKGTYNEQVFNERSKEIRFTNNPNIVIRDVDINRYSLVWRKVK